MKKNVELALKILQGLDVGDKHPIQSYAQNFAFEAAMKEANKTTKAFDLHFDYNKAQVNVERLK
tara:strand:+ start:1097 stop:1288 length:192 start_codon:yes stop_codon:yes gene_type:complete